jgi:hypothetical protein
MSHSENHAHHQVNLSELIGKEGSVIVLLTAAGRVSGGSANSMSCVVRMGKSSVPLEFPSPQAVGQIKLTLQPLEAGQAPKHVSITATQQGQWKMNITQAGKPPIDHTVWTAMDVPLNVQPVDMSKPDGDQRVVPCRVVSASVSRTAALFAHGSDRDSHVPSIWSRSGSDAYLFAEPASNTPRGR